MKTLAFFFVLVASLHAADPVKIDSLTVNGREYKNTSIEKLDEISARVVHSTGAARIPLALLSEELQQQLGYDARAAEAAAIAASKAEQARQEKAALDAIEPTRFWVSENLETGLVVGNFVKITTGGGYIGTGGSRTGNGGGGFYSKGKTTWEHGEEIFFIPHTAQTRNFIVDHEFQAKVIKDGTKRLDGSTVVTKFKLISLVKP